jgi:type II secretion system protein L
MAMPAAASRLQLHVPERWPDVAREPQVRWVLRDDAGVEDGVAPLAELPRADQTILVLPFARVAFVRAALPHGPARRLAKLAPFAIEDEIVSAPERVHCAVIDAAGDERLIAVLERDWLESVLAELASFGIHPDRVIAESALLVSDAETWTVVWSGDGGFAALGGVEAIALDASVNGRPPLALQLAVRERRRTGGGPRAVRVLTSGAVGPPETAKWTKSLDVPVASAGKWRPETSDAGTAAVGADLLPCGRAGGTRATATWFGRLAGALLRGADTRSTVGAILARRRCESGTPRA